MSTDMLRRLTNCRLLLLLLLLLLLFLRGAKSLKLRIYSYVAVSNQLCVATDVKRTA